MVNSQERILVVGSGGREHALAWWLSWSPYVDKLFIAPGNPGSQEVGKNVDIAATDISRLTAFAKDNKIDLTVVGPEAPLALGIVDSFREAKLAICGPTQKAAQLETSKVFSSEFMDRHGIPHPKARSFTSFQDASDYIAKTPAENIVIKADGLAAGKGVVLPPNTGEAQFVLYGMMQEGLLGDSGRTVLIQERLTGPEISVHAITDGSRIIPMVAAQDHKRLLDGDRGPNTGGMGAYAPVPFVSDKEMEEIQKKILQPTVDGMREEGMPYHGVLYAGIMLTPDGPKVLEYNSRFGDPEAQPLMMLLLSDLSTFLYDAAREKLEKKVIRFHKGYAASVVMASNGYPTSSEKGKEIHLGWPRDPDVVIFHAGTMVKNGKLVTNGGRVLSVTAYSQTLESAITKAYKYIDEGKVKFDGMQYRRDIGQKGILYERNGSV